MDINFIVRKILSLSPEGRIYTASIDSRSDGSCVQKDSMGNLIAAAGDPTFGKIPDKILKEVPDSFSGSKSPTTKEIKRDSYTIFHILGNSMAPRGVFNSDLLLCTEFTEDSKEIKNGDFIIIEVDKAFYRSHGRKALYDYKLRRFVSEIPTWVDCDSEFSISKFALSLKGTANSLLLKDKRKELIKSLKEAKESYPEEKNLLLSETFRNGKVHYSVHPANLVRYKAIYKFQGSDSSLQPVTMSSAK